jgi:hypothetical protein
LDLVGALKGLHRLDFRYVSLDDGFWQRSSAMVSLPDAFVICRGAVRAAARAAPPASALAHP